MQLRGCGTALVTPFHQDGSIDDAALRNLVAWQVESGIDFLVPCGTTGETPTLTHDEWLYVIDTTIEVVAGRVPIVAGRDVQRHARRGREGERNRHASRSQRHPHRLALLQQAHAGRPVPPFQGDRRSGRRQARHSLQRARPHRREPRTRNAGAPRRDSQHRGRERSQRQHDPDCRSDQRRPRNFPGVLGGRRGHPAGHRSRRRRDHFGRRQRNSARNGGAHPRGSRTTTGPRPALCIANICR